MKNIYRIFSLFIATAVLVACSTEDDLVEDWIEVNELESPSSGTLDLSNYVAVGNSMTAGFADGALYPESQEDSYPNIIANQFLTAGGGAFVQPDITSGNGFGGVNGTEARGKSFISLEAAVAALAGTGSFGDVIQFTEGEFLSQSSNTGSGLNNFGVPGARVVDLTTAGYGFPDVGNPFYTAFASDPSTSSILDDAVSANASFFTLWIGANDVLGYAAAGGDENLAQVTATADFQTAYATVLTSLTANGAQGIVLNVPPITIIPYFQTVTSLSGGVNILPAGSIDAPTATFLNSASAYGAYNAGLDQMVALTLITQEEADWRKITFTGDVANAPIITDESLTDLSGFGLESIRQAKVDPTTGSSDLFPLTALSVVGTEAVPGNASSVYGVGVPVPDQYSFTMEEQVTAITGYATFNAVIDGIVSANDNVTMVDVRPLFADMYGLSAAQATALQLGEAGIAAADGALGIEIGGINLVPLSLSTTELYNSVWSTDGVHPNSRGAAIIANEVIRAVNARFNATIPEVNPLDFAPINAPF